MSPCTCPHCIALRALLKAAHVPTVYPPVREFRFWFACEACDWRGEDPRWQDTADAFDPPRGDIPCCPACGSWQVMLMPEEVPL